jgi:hypothetical protein
MEALTRMVADSLARHGMDRPVDPRRLQWSRWFRCDSTHSLLVVPSRPGIFALAEEVVNLGAPTDHVAAEAPVRRMLAIIQFAEDDDMAFVLDRMFTRINPMRERLASGSCFLRFVVIEDQAQRRSICSALNQWTLASAEKASGLPADFSSSLEFARVSEPARAAEATRMAEATRVGAGDSPASVENLPDPALVPQPLRQTKTNIVSIARNIDSGAAKNLHCSQPLPSGF